MNVSKLARSAAGLSLRELEDQLGGLVTAQAIGKYERDEMMPGSEVLIALGRALSVSEDYLLRHDDVELVSVEFRKQRLEKAKDRARVRAQILSAVERYLEVEDLLALSSIGAPRRDSLRRQVGPKMAKRRRQSCGLRGILASIRFRALLSFLKRRRSRSSQSLAGARVRSEGECQAEGRHAGPSNSSE